MRCPRALACARARCLRKIAAHEAYIPYRFVDGVTESAGIPMPECDDLDSTRAAGVRGVRAMAEKLRREPGG